MSSKAQIAFTVYGDPVPKGSTVPFPLMKDGKPVLGKGGRPVVVIQNANKNTKQWQTLVALASQEHRPEKLFSEAVVLRLRFFFTRPKSISVKKRPNHTVKPDLDKLIRCVGDALKGKIYAEDALIVSIEATKEYGDPPRVEISVSEVTVPGQKVLFE